MNETITLDPPFPWFGGKRRVAPLVWQYLGEDVLNYIEPFAGGLATLLYRPHAPQIETVNDLDGYICNFWRAVKNKPDEVAHYADWPVNEVDLHARHHWLVYEAGVSLKDNLLKDPEWCDAKVAGWWVWGICQWIGGGWCEKPENTGRVNVGRASRGINAALHQKKPNVGNRGKGVSSLKYQRPHLGDSGRGVLAQNLPKLNGLRTAHATDLYSYMSLLSERLRRVRIACGDWARVCSPAATYKIGMTAIFLDPPYSAESGRFKDLYNQDSFEVAHEVRNWCLEHHQEKYRGEVVWEGPRYQHPKLRIALCGYEDEHAPYMPDDWTMIKWKAPGGYGNQRQDNQNSHLERIWFSPNCLRPADDGEGQLKLL